MLKNEQLVQLIDTAQLGTVIGLAVYNNPEKEYYVVEWQSGMASRQHISSLIPFRDYIVEGFTPTDDRTSYEMACDFIGVMTRAGFFSNVTIGGVFVNCNEQQVEHVIATAHLYGCSVRHSN